MGASKNQKGVYLEGHTDKGGNMHVNVYNNNPTNPNHSSIHVNVNSKTGKGTIVEKSGSSKTTTNIGCYLTSACMRYYLNNFQDNCFELSVLRWFRDNFVSEEDIKIYYEVAPLIVNIIEKDQDKARIYDYIYDTIVDFCVQAILNGNYNLAYERYKSSILNLQEIFLRKSEVSKKLIKSL